MSLYDKKFNYLKRTVAILFVAIFLFWSAPVQAKVPVIVLGDYLNLVKKVKEFEAAGGKLKGVSGWSKLDEFFYAANTQKDFDEDKWSGAKDKESLKNSLAKFWHNAIMEKNLKKDLKWEGGGAWKEQQTIKKDDSMKDTMRKLVHDAIAYTDKEDDGGSSLAWLKKAAQKDKYAEESDDSTWTFEKRKKEALKDFLIDLLEEAIMDSLKKVPEGEKKFKYSWLESWNKEQRNEASTKDFAIDLVEQAVQRASQSVRDPSKNAEYFQDKTGEDGKKKVKKELSKATLKEFLLYIKDSQEQFFYDFTQNMWGDNAEKIWEEYKTYELAKIEKAREDVSKLMYETMKELKEEPTIIRKIKTQDGMAATWKELDEYLRTMGLKISSSQDTDCSWGIKVEGADSDEGQCVVIKESGRAIRNINDFVYGEAYEKARDYIMCYLSPWKHFSFGVGGVEDKKDWDIGEEEDWCPQDPDEQSKYYKKGRIKRGASCNPKENDYCLPKCSSEFICEIKAKEAGDRPDMFSDDFAEYKKKLCPSDQQKEDLKRNLLFELAQERNVLDTMPPEKWYYGELKAESEHHSAWWAQGKQRCTLIMDSIPGAEGGRKEIKMANDLKEQRVKAFSEWEKNQNETDILIQKGKSAGQSRKEMGYLSSLANPLNQLSGVEEKVQNKAEEIYNETVRKQGTLYNTGDGIAPKQQLIGWQADPDDEDRDDIYTVNTGEIISPAKILTSKIEASQQAQFDLAMKAWKKQPEGYEQTEWTCPEPSAGEVKEKCYNKLKCGEKVECEESGKQKLKRKWYKVKVDYSDDDSINKPEDPRLKYQCKYPVFNELTCRRFGDFETEVARYTSFEELPHELPAPSEDPGEYAKVPKSYMAEANKEGKREPPPDFRRDKEGDGDTAYEDGLWEEFPDIYGEEGEDGPYPRKKENVPKVLKKEWGQNRSSERYYLNKYYKDVTQLYEKPMSQVMCEWFVGEDMISKDDTKSTIFQDNSKLKNSIYDYCLPTTKDDYESLEEPTEGKVPTEKGS